MKKSLKALAEFISEKLPLDNYVIHTHPHNMKLLKDHIEKHTPKQPQDTPRMFISSAIQIITCEYIDRYAKKWVFPDDPMWEYEKEDETWCRFFGLGREVQTVEPVFYLMNKSAFVSTRRMFM